jgi:hypothetical protein
LQDAPVLQQGAQRADDQNQRQYFEGKHEAGAGVGFYEG